MSAKEAPTTAALPETIGKYRIEGLIAKGGMGSVFKAMHPTLKRSVIIKKLSVRGNPHFIERFKREAEIMMDFRHKNIVNFYDHFKEGSSYYIVLEYVDGFSLDELIRQQRSLPSLLALSIFYEISKALKYAHDCGVIHRDIKPANILISKTGEVKLVDFGIAGYESNSDPSSDGLTAHGMTLGTVSYMPPEQFENTKSVDKSADIYAMGVMLYEMVTGKKPFAGDLSPSNLLLIKKGKYLRVKKLNPRLDSTVIRLCNKMIRAKKTERYRDMQQVIDLLEQRLKKEKATELDKHLVALMNNVKYQPPKVGILKSIKRVVSTQLLIIFALSTIFAYLIYSGLWFEWFYAESHGAVRLEILSEQQPLDLTTPLLSAQIRPVLSPSNTDKASGLAAPTNLPTPSFYNSLLSFFGVGKQGKTSSDRTFLPMGWYFLELGIDNKFYQELFYLQPHSVQKSEGRSSGLVLKYPAETGVAQTLRLKFNVFDRRINQDITAQAQIMIKNESAIWENLQDYPKERLVSGKNYRFRVASPGYYQQELSIDVGPLQSDLRLNISMQARSGALVISSKIEGLTLSINGRRSMLNGEKTPKLIALNLEADKPLFLALSPGALRIEVQTGSKKTHINLDLRSDTRRNVSVLFKPGSTDPIIKEIP